ncbi:hypothetical protein VMCG_02373 [Cytospora schulzeri]|uniref:Uncharacterized protein n=1 Tax=Cytospora schulzeri TaxID=448051 RepID=A0A423X1S0_9PEZI|nr:hypothetical protein VMCG_02373 [Valsa malicola]
MESSKGSPDLTQHHQDAELPSTPQLTFSAASSATAVNQTSSQDGDSSLHPLPLFSSSGEPFAGTAPDRPVSHQRDFTIIPPSWPHAPFGWASRPRAGFTQQPAPQYQSLRRGPPYRLDDDNSTETAPASDPFRHDTGSRALPGGSPVPAMMRQRRLRRSRGSDRLNAEYQRQGDQPDNNIDPATGNLELEGVSQVPSYKKVQVEPEPHELVIPPATSTREAAGSLGSTTAGDEAEDDCDDDGFEEIELPQSQEPLIGEEEGWDDLGIEHGTEAFQGDLVGQETEVADRQEIEDVASQATEVEALVP